MFFWLRLPSCEECLRGAVFPGDVFAKPDPEMLFVFQRILSAQVTHGMTQHDMGFPVPVCGFVETQIGAKVWDDVADVTKFMRQSLQGRV